MSIEIYIKTTILRILHKKTSLFHLNKSVIFLIFTQESNEAEEDKSLSEHSSGEARGHVSETSLSLELRTIQSLGVTGTAIECPLERVAEALPRSFDKLRMTQARL